MSDTQQGSPPLIPHRTYQPSFSSGELAPALWWRSDQARWRVGAAVLQNLIVTAQGGAARRGGLQYAAVAANNSGQQRLIPFQFSTEQQYVLEMGDQYFRFVLQGAYIMAGSAPYQIATPYVAADLFLIQFTQSADVLTLTHTGYPPMQLKRFGLTNWTLSPVPIGTQLAPPAGLTAAAADSSTPPGPTASTTTASLTFVYAVTASTFADNDESQLSNTATCQNEDLGYYNQYGVSNVLNWQAVAGADFYTVYRQYQGVWSKIGSTTALAFQDINYVPDTANGPPQATNPFVGPGNYPGTVGYFQERVVYGGTSNAPETIECSKSGNYTNFDVSNPVRDDDAISYTLAARQVNQIRHLIALSDLMIFTGGGGWRLSGQNGAVTPSNFDVAPQSFVGSSTVAPLVIGNRILFIEAKGQSIREIAYQFVQNMYVSEDRSVWSRHLFAGHSIVDWAYAESPEKIVWAVRDDGALLSLTYLIEQDIYAWTEHNTEGGYFKSVCVVTETVNLVTEDVPYFVVQRAINGQFVTFIERMHTRLLGLLNDDVTQAWHVDCGLQYFGPPATVISGLDYLDGVNVAYLADGLPGTATVEGGSITIPVASKRVTVGIPMGSTLTTLPLDGPNPAVDPMMGRLKHGFRARVAFENTAGVFGQVDGQALTEFVDPDADPFNPTDPPGMFTGVMETRLAEGWTRNGQLSIQMVSPLPATVLGVAMEWDVGL